jgi:hypothetical protein
VETVTVIVCHSEDKPIPERRIAGQVFYEWDKPRHAMWDGQDWVEVTFESGQWRPTDQEEWRP